MCWTWLITVHQTVDLLPIRHVCDAELYGIGCPLPLRQAKQRVHDQHINTSIYLAVWLNSYLDHMYRILAKTRLCYKERSTMARDVIRFRISGQVYTSGLHLSISANTFLQGVCEPSLGRGSLDHHFRSVETDSHLFYHLIQTGQSFQSDEDFRVTTGD